MFAPAHRNLQADKLREEIQRRYPQLPAPWLDAIVAQCSEESGQVRQLAVCHLGVWSHECAAMNVQPVVISWNQLVTVEH